MHSPCYLRVDTCTARYRVHSIRRWDARSIPPQLVLHESVAHMLLYFWRFPECTISLFTTTTEGL